MSTSTINPTVAATGRTRHPAELSGHVAPEYRGVTPPPTCSGLQPGTYTLHDDEHERVTLPDGTVAFVLEVAGCWGLWTHLVAVDAGGNRLGRAVAATESTIGIARHRDCRHVIPQGLVGWLAD